MKQNHAFAKFERRKRVIFRSVRRNGKWSFPAEAGTVALAAGEIGISRWIFLNENEAVYLAEDRNETVPEFTGVAMEYFENQYWGTLPKELQ